MSEQERCNNYVCDFFTALDSAIDGASPQLQSHPDVTTTNAFFAVCTAPEVVILKPTKDESRRGLQGILDSLGDISHTALDIAGLLPMFGEVADLANAGLYVVEGDFMNATLSAAAAIPFYGNAVAACKLGRIQAQADDVADDMRDLTESISHRSGGGGDASALAVALPALAFGIVLGAVGARKYWYKGLRSMARARMWLRRKQEQSDTSINSRA